MVLSMESCWEWRKAWMMDHSLADQMDLSLADQMDLMMDQSLADQMDLMRALMTETSLAESRDVH